MASCFPHREQNSVSNKRILCNLVYVGKMSLTTIYHIDLAPSDVIALWKVSALQPIQFPAGAALGVPPVACIQLCTSFAGFRIHVS